MKKLNDETRLKARQINQWILNQDVVKEYQRYEKLVKNDLELQSLEETLKDLQKQIVNDKHLGIDCQSLINDYEIKKKQFHENPLVYNYLVLKQEVNELILQVQDDINNLLKKMVD